jgi:hypothetical protein
MAFSNFTLVSALEQFGLSITTNRRLFLNVNPVDAGSNLKGNLDRFQRLAFSINTEKARSEWLISPVLGELWSRAWDSISLLSGVDFVVDKEAGLSGVVDFMVGKGPQTSFVIAPILAIVEAKNESIPGGQGQCAAEMVASLRFNQKKKSQIDTVYGIVTNGENWLFHQLHDTEFVIDTMQYKISEVDQILGILLHIVGLNPVEEKSHAV